MSSKQPLHEQLYAAMAERIRLGHWPEGERVPSEKALEEEFGTSRGPVRQALARLRAEGLIVGGRGAPPRVQRAVPAQSFDTYMSFTEWAEELGRVPGQKTIEVTRRLADERLARDLRIEPDSPVVEVVRLRTFDDEPVMLERSAYALDIGKHLLAVDLDTHSIYQTLQEQGITQTRARNVIDAIAASAFDAQWFGIEVGSPLLRVRRIAFDEAGSVVDVVENHYLPSKATFAVENIRDQRTPLSRVTVDGESRV